MDSRPRKVCSFFLNNQCKKGTSCTFLHQAGPPNPETIIEQAPSVRRNFSQTPCRYGANCTFQNCKFSHPGQVIGEGVMPGADIVSPGANNGGGAGSIAVCRNIAKYGQCTFQGCRFFHPQPGPQPGPLPGPSPGPRPGPIAFVPDPTQFCCSKKGCQPQSCQLAHWIETQLEIDLKTSVLQSPGDINILASELHMQQLILAIEIQNTYHIVAIDMASGNKITFQRGVPNKPIDIVSMDTNPMIQDQASLVYIKLQHIISAISCPSHYKQF